VNADCSVKLCDFGLARGLELEEEASPAAVAPVAAAAGALDKPKPKVGITGYVKNKNYDLLSSSSFLFFSCNVTKVPGTLSLVGTAPRRLSCWKRITATPLTFGAAAA
jgi:hypothetical protein